MGRLPFHEHSVRPAQAAKTAAPPLTVSQMADKIAAAVRSHLGEPVRVVGQVSGFRDRTHWYFDIKDAAAVLRCVMWQSNARRAACVPRDGQDVIVTGAPDYYGAHGRLSMVVTKIEPVGEGELELAYRRLCEELRALGYFAQERKRTLPPFPRRVAVITSRTGAALRDVRDTFARRFPAIEIALLDVRVQGDGAAPEIARAVRWVSASHAKLGVDALLVTRGGGSAQDLWAFNERIVADAIATCAIPVVCAIGHESDTTIAELVADVRAATPTQATMVLSPDAPALREQLDALAGALTGRMRRLLESEDRRLTSAARRPAMANPRIVLDRAAQRTDACAAHLATCAGARAGRARARLETAARALEQHRPVAVHARKSAQVDIAAHRLGAVLQSRFSRVAQRLDAREQTLRAVGPANILQRGFSYTSDDQGRLIRDAAQLTPGEHIRTRLARGSVWSTVDRTEA